MHTLQDSFYRTLTREEIANVKGGLYVHVMRYHSTQHLI